MSLFVLYRAAGKSTSTLMYMSMSIPLWRMFSRTQVVVPHLLWLGSLPAQISAANDRYMHPLPEVFSPRSALDAYKLKHRKNSHHAFLTAPHRTQVPSCAACDPGTYTDSLRDRCIACSAGYSCSDPTLGEVLCEGGFFSAVGYIACVECPAGSFCTSPFSVAQPCGAGTYSTM